MTGGPQRSRSRSAALDPEKVVASFDSASVLHAATVAALSGRPFPHLGSPAAYAAAVRAAGHLPWPVLREIYARIGGAEGVPPEKLARVDMGAVAASFAGAYPERRYPGVLLGSSNGALSHLAAALQIPWLPGTVLIPVSRVADPQRPDLALRFGREKAPALLTANPDIALHQMHDAAQDELMVARMTYFRTKWRALPEAYARFLTDRLAPRAPVIIVDDRSRWPVVRVGERHVFQVGGRGGLSPGDYLKRPHTPQPDDEAPEAEWGSDESFVEAVSSWCGAHGHPLVRLVFDGPQAASHPVAVTIRDWYAELGRPTGRLIVPSFVLGDPWQTLAAGRVPYWTFFAVDSALTALDSHLARVSRYREVAVLIFQHGARSPGYAAPEAWRRVVERHGAEFRLVAVDERRSPHDIGSLGRYGPELQRWSDEPTGWSPLAVDVALSGLAAAGLDVVRC